VVSWTSSVGTPGYMRSSRRGRRQHRAGSSGAMLDHCLPVVELSESDRRDKPIASRVSRTDMAHAGGMGDEQLWAVPAKPTIVVGGAAATVHDGLCPEKKYTQ